MFLSISSSFVSRKSSIAIPSIQIIIKPTDQRKAGCWTKIPTGVNEGLSQINTGTMNFGKLKKTTAAINRNWLIIDQMFILFNLFSLCSVNCFSKPSKTVCFLKTIFKTSYILFLHYSIMVWELSSF